MTLTVVLVTVLVMMSRLVPGLATYQHARPCQEITIPLCQDATLGYNLTVFPNVFRHAHQDDAGMEVHQFFPLVKVGCSESLQPFLCLLYVPECQDQAGVFKSPCRELCQDSRDGCESLMNKFGFPWPEKLDCAQFPSAEAGQECAAPPASSIATHTTSPTAEDPPPTDPLVTSPPTAAPVESSAEPPRYFRQEASTTAGVSDTAAPVNISFRQLDILERLLESWTRLHRVQEETLVMQQQNMQLKKRKLQMEIRLLQKQLGEN